MGEPSAKMSETKSGPAEVSEVWTGIEGLVAIVRGSGRTSLPLGDSGDEFADTSSLVFLFDWMI
jgi:hypothetical protein